MVFLWIKIYGFCWTLMNAPSKSVSETCKLAIPLEYVPFLSEKDGRGIARIGNFRFKEIAPFNNYNLVQFSLSVLTRPSLFYRENYPKFTLFPRFSFFHTKVTKLFWLDSVISPTETNITKLARRRWPSSLEPKKCCLRIGLNLTKMKDLF